VLRDGKDMSLPIAVGEMKESEVVASGGEGGLGLTVQPVTPEIAESLGINRTDGVVITNVTPGGAADEAGLREGDLITQVNRNPVKNLADYNREMAKSGKSKSVLLLVKRGDQSVFLALKK
jgi:serine protease Do